MHSSLTLTVGTSVYTLPVYLPVQLAAKRLSWARDSRGIFITHLPHWQLTMSSRRDVEPLKINRKWIIASSGTWDWCRFSSRKTLLMLDFIGFRDRIGGQTRTRTDQFLDSRNICNLEAAVEFYRLLSAIPVPDSTPYTRWYGSGWVSHFTARLG